MDGWIDPLKPGQNIKKYKNKKSEIIFLKRNTKLLTRKQQQRQQQQQKEFCLNLV